MQRTGVVKGAQDTLRPYSHSYHILTHPYQMGLSKTAMLVFQMGEYVCGSNKHPLPNSPDYSYRLSNNQVCLGIIIILAVV